MPKARLGVALLLPPGLAEEVDGLRRALGDPALGRIPPHLTLVPPVNVREDRIPEALGVLRAAAAAARPFTLELGPPATFLPVNPVAYLSVAGEVDHLVALRRAVSHGALARPVTRPFVPHVTVADEAAPERIAAALLALADYRASLRVERVHLLREGPDRVWQPVADAPLAPPAVVGRGGLELELSVSEQPGPETTAFVESQWRREEEACGQRSERFAVTARRDGRVAGAATGTVRGDVAYLEDLIVDAATRREGVGSHLVAVVGSLAAERGCRALRVRASVGGAPETFFRGRGFAEVSRRGGGAPEAQLQREL